MDGFEFNYYKSNFEETDPFMLAWKEQGKDQVRRLNKLVPPSWLNANPDYYQVRVEVWNCHESQALQFQFQVKLIILLHMC